MSESSSYWLDDNATQYVGSAHEICVDLSEPEVCRASVETPRSGPGRLRRHPGQEGRGQKKGRSHTPIRIARDASATVFPLSSAASASASPWRSSSPVTQHADDPSNLHRAERPLWPFSQARRTSVLDTLSLCKPVRVEQIAQAGSTASVNEDVTQPVPGGSLAGPHTGPLCTVSGSRHVPSEGDIVRDSSVRRWAQSKRSSISQSGQWLAALQARRSVRTTVGPMFISAGSLIRTKRRSGWHGCLSSERKVLVDELVESVTVWRDHVSVAVAGAPPLSVTLEEVGLKESWFLVSEGGLEPPRPCGHQPLKLARLPIPPLRRACKWESSVARS